MNQAVPIERIVDIVLCLDGDALSSLIKSAIEQDQDLAVVLNSGLVAGLRKLGKGFERGEICIPELKMGADRTSVSTRTRTPHHRRPDHQRNLLVWRWRQTAKIGGGWLGW